MARDDVTLACLTSLKGPGATAWVYAVPAHDDATFTPVEWSISAVIRLGLPIHQLMVAGKCVYGVEFKDPSDPHHALCCKHQYAPSRVHDAVKLVVAKIAKASGGVVTIEDDTLLAGKRVDVAVRRPMDGEAHALEVSVVDPVFLSVQQHGQCGRTVGYAAKERERRKAVDYHPFLQRHKGVPYILGEGEADWVDRRGERQEIGGGAPWVDLPYLVDMQL
ncbi:unnamed protein product [Closterium sp. NIES-65]|nr:unnamed protein product [Closterium sp. NIES-65]